MEQADASKRFRVLIVEDQPTIREAIASEFELEPDFELVGKAGSLAEARKLLDGADVAILDLGLPDGSGADLIPELAAANPKAKVLVLTSTYDPGEIRGAIERGATAALDKLAHLGQVPQTVRRLLADEPLVPSGDHLR
jgi:DNA-binding NarL/FixJ family response regulator